MYIITIQYNLHIIRQYFLRATKSYIDKYMTILTEETSQMKQWFSTSIFRTSANVIYPIQQLCLIGSKPVFPSFDGPFEKQQNDIKISERKCRSLMDILRILVKNFDSTGFYLRVNLFQWEKFSYLLKIILYSESA